ncbi:MAG: hypothetical protein AAFX09_13725 [Pseudomonadota bacterium]
MRGKDLVGFFNLIVIVGVLGAISYAATQLQPEEYDPDTLCPTDVTAPHAAVIIDKTDRYSPEEAERIGNLILNARDGLEIGERFSLFELDERGDLANTESFSLCNPGRGDQISPLYRNPARVETRYQSQFEAPLQRALADLVEPKDSPQSPIIEALARLALEDGFGQDVPRREVALVSDMLQNSDLFSVYGAARYDLSRLPDPARVADAIEDRYGDGLAGLRVQVFLIERRGWTEAQADALPQYWDQVFARLGVRARWNQL